MRTFSQGRVALGVMLAAAFLWSVAAIGLAAPPAQAQVATGGRYGTPSVATRGGAAQSVAVVPFENSSGYRTETFGQEASDAVATELRDRLLLDILPKSDVELWLRDLGYKPPLSDAELVRLASELEVNMVVTGQVRSVRVVSTPEGRAGEVVLAVLLFDRMAQTAVNGALIKVQGPPSTEASDDTLITKALQQAAFDVVQHMRTRPTVTAMVLWARDSTVFLNVGGRAGVENGMDMVAIRNGLRIGLAEVTEANPIGSYAKVVQGPPLRTGDQLRAIYRLPAGVAAPSPAKIQRKRQNMTNMLLAAAALFGIADLGATSRQMEEGGFAAPAFIASNLSNGLATLQPQAISLPIFDPDLKITRAASLITWIPFNGSEKNRIWGYEIWRDQALMEVIPVSGEGENYTFDLPRPTFTQRVVTGTVDQTTGITLVGTDSRTIVTSRPAQVITYADTSVSFSFEQAGPAPGQAYVYRIRPILVEQRLTSTAVFLWAFVRGAELSSFTNRLTAVNPPFNLVGTASGTSASFSFYSPNGADEAVVQIARDPNDNFPPDKVYVKSVPGVFPGPTTTSAVVNDFKNLPGSGNIFWWRVGVRNRFDSYVPRPWPPTLTNDYGYIWSYPALKFTVGTATTSVSELQRRRELLRRGTLGRPRDSRRPDRVTGDRVLQAR